MLHVLMSQAQKHSDAVSHPVDHNLFNGAILFQYTDILMHGLQLILGKLPKHKTGGVFSGAAW